ncbi:hypothetical protein OAA45_00155 [bacterium]|nr:hypothetical protein [bacterium]
MNTQSMNTPGIQSSTSKHFDIAIEGSETTFVLHILAQAIERHYCAGMLTPTDYWLHTRKIMQRIAEIESH